MTEKDKATKRTIKAHFSLWSKIPSVHFLSFGYQSSVAVMDTHVSWAMTSYLTFLKFDHFDHYFAVQNYSIADDRYLCFIQADRSGGALTVAVMNEEDPGIRHTVHIVIYLDFAMCDWPWYFRVYI